MSTNNSDNENVKNRRHSYHSSLCPKPQHTDTFSKSDLDCSVTGYSESSISPYSSDDVYSNRTRIISADCRQTSHGEYYKNYEHDEVPVKDSDNVLTIGNATRSMRKSLTNSDLDNIERRIFKNVSQELQTDDASLSSLESNIKFFKTTVEKIFDYFYTCMSDFDLYKKRFNEILNKSKEGSIDDMEEFIRDMFEHIMSAEQSLSKVSRHSTEIESELDEAKNYVSSCGDSAQDSSSVELQEAFKNERYLTDSTDSSNRSKKKAEAEERFNIFYLTGNPRVEINLVGRNMLSEVNMKELDRHTTTNSIASADNLKKVAAKKIELEKHMKSEHDSLLRNDPDRDIPVKVSFAKKNIYLNEDFARNAENNGSPKSFLAKLCSHLCRKFRRNTFG